MVEPDKPQMIICRMRFACWAPKATNTHSQYTILIALPLQRWSQKRASLLCNTHIASLVFPFFFWRNPSGPGPSHSRRFQIINTTTHHSRYDSSGREISRDLYLTTYNTHNRQTSMPPVGFEPAISAGELQQTCALDRAAIGT